jgi:uncharacterized protein YybS (DUF2232 family)
VSQRVRDPRKEFFMATAITSVMALAGLYLPVFGILVSIFIPLPILFFRLKLGRYGGALVLLAVTIIVATVMQWRSITATVFFFELCLIGFVLSEMFEMKLTLEKTVAATTGVVVGTGAFMLALYGLLTPESIWDQLSGYLQSNLQLALDVYKELEVPQEQIDFVAGSMESILYVMLRIMPAIVIATTLLVVWSNLLVARPLLQNNRLDYPEFGVLREWKAPEPLVWVAIGSAILLLVPHKGLRILGVNGLIIMMMIYFFQGIAIVSYYFDKKNFPKILKAILYGLIAIQQFVLLLVIAAGFFDLWVDFRRLKKGESKKNESDTERND